jgi:hypothetical protein
MGSYSLDRGRLESMSGGPPALTRRHQPAAASEPRLPPSGSSEGEPDRAAEPCLRPVPLREEVLDISSIRRDGDTQGRVTINDSVVEEYAGLIESGVRFPPVRVWLDKDDYWLSDGFQRIAAHELLGKTQIAAIVFCGTVEDARWDSYAANATHGLRRTRADLECVMMRALAHPRSAPLSNYQLASYLNTPEATVRRWRAKLCPASVQAGTRLAVRNGATYLINIGAIGRTPKDRMTAPRSLDDCKRGLKEMRQLASVRATPMFEMLDSWVRGKISSTVCLEGVESILR